MYLGRDGTGATGSSAGENARRLDPVAFSAHLSHELRTPTANIATAAALLGGEADPEAKRRLVGIIASNAVRLQGLIGDILDFDTILSGKMELHLTMRAARDLALAAADAIRCWASSRGVSIAVDIAEGLLLEADGGRVEQVLINLLGNAVKFSPAQGVVRVSAARSFVGGRESVVFTVVDQGPGVKPQLRSFVFDAFVTAAVDGRKTEGTGLGLTLCRMIVAALGGQIWLDDSLGGGASFSFSVPLRAGCAVPPATVPQLSHWRSALEFAGMLAGACLAALWHGMTAARGWLS